MKIKYNFNQNFELVEIDMYYSNLVFKTNDGMNEFENSYEDFTKDEDGNTIFNVYFADINDLGNIPKLLFEYLTDNDLVYLND